MYIDLQFYNKNEYIYEKLIIVIYKINIWTVILKHESINNDNSFLVFRTSFQKDI